MKLKLAALVIALFSATLCVAQTTRPYLVVYYVSQPNPPYSPEPFVPYVVVLISHHSLDMDGFTVTLSYTNSLGAAMSMKQAVVRTPVITGLAFQVGAGMSNFKASAVPFKSSGPAFDDTFPFLH
jgi:hypothetical protein